MNLTARDLSINYANANPVFEGLTHEFPAGTVTAIIGRSGSGKSTLLYSLALMLTPSHGDVLWGGRSTARASDSDRSLLRAELSGFVFQDALLDLGQSVLDNVLEAAWIGGRFDAGVKDFALELLERFGVDEHAYKRPGQVSGGQAQRIALCRALVRRPAVLFADEPTGNLDADTASTVWTALTETATDGATVIVATHDRERAATFDHLLDLGVVRSDAQP